MKYQDTITYYDELNDDFAGTNIKVVPLPKKYKMHSKNPFVAIFNFFIYWIFARPLVWCYMKVKFHYTIKNRKIVKELKKTGYFIYGNHSLLAGDAFGPSLIDFRKRNYIVTGEDTCSLTKILWLLRGLGLLPVINDLKRNVELMDTLKYIIVEKKNTVAIYPEAHIWPYYTGIRNFRYESFKYPALFNVPVICLTHVYTKRKFVKTPKITSYLNGPFYPDQTLDKNQRAKALRDQVYNAMVENSKLSTYQYFNYVKGEKNEREN